MTNLKTLFTLILAIMSLDIFSQHAQHADEDMHHHEHQNEIGIANSLVYFTNEKVTAYSIHLHYIRTLPETKFGLGFGYERIFDDHRHSTVGLVGSYRPLDNLSFSISPGLTFEKGEQTGRFALHFETAYEWEIHDFHIGPVLEMAYDPEDYHLSLGLHFGYGF